MTITKHEVYRVRVNRSALGDHHILVKVEKDMEGNIKSQAIVMFGGHPEHMEPE